MLLQKESWRLGYHQLLSDCLPSNQSTGGTVLILANTDVDALCAARILSYALRADKVPYQLRPCGGFNYLLRILQKLRLNENDGVEATIRAVILLNLGATRNLEKALFQPTATLNADGEKSYSPPLLDRNQTKLYVLDSHRPYHLANIHAPKNIVLWNDYNWHDDEGGIPSDGEYLDDESDGDDEVEEADTEDESEDDVSNLDKEAEFDDESDKSNHLSDSSVDEDESNTNTVSSEASHLKSRKKARIVPDEESEAQRIGGESELDGGLSSMPEKHQSRRDRIWKYYRSGSFYSSPVAFMSYTLLAEQLRHDAVGDLLWLA